MLLDFTHYKVDLQALQASQIRFDHILQIFQKLYAVCVRVCVCALALSQGWLRASYTVILSAGSCISMRLTRSLALSEMWAHWRGFIWIDVKTHIYM